MTQKVEGTLLRTSTAGRGASSTSITSVTAAVDPVVTAAAHGLKDGDVIEITGATVSALNQMHTVAVLTAGTFALPGLDLSMFSTITAGGSFKTVVMSQLCDATSIDLSEYEVNSENKNTFCRKDKSFNVELGTMSVGLYAHSDDKHQTYLRNSGKKLEVIMIQFMPKGAKWLRGFLGQVTSANISGDVDGDYEGTLEISLLSFSQDVELDLVP